MMNPEGKGWISLASYVIAATLARTADGGAVVAVVLLTTMEGGGSVTAGILGACITGPHLLGPFVARQIDLAHDGRKIIAYACVLYSLALALAIASYGYVPLAVTGMFLIVAGCCGPLLTGGISTRLPALAGNTLLSQRRAQGWDIATYGIGGTVGPSLVAAASSFGSPTLAGFILAIAALLSSCLVMCLPYSAPEHGGDPSSVPSAWQTIVLMIRDGRLRRTLYMTMLVAFSMAALPITAIYMAPILGVAPASAAVITAAYGVGNLSGSIGIMFRPLQGEPDRLISLLSVWIVVGLIAVVMSKSFLFSLLAYWGSGVLNAFFFAATLAARTEYAPKKGRGQVFLWVAAMKITAGSAGTAIAGILIGISVVVPLVLSITLIALSSLISYLERTIESRKNNNQ